MLLIHVSPSVQLGVATDFSKLRSDPEACIAQPYLTLAHLGLLPLAQIGQPSRRVKRLCNPTQTNKYTHVHTQTKSARTYTHPK